ncbi:AI-2E family transporter [Microbacterium sp. p3-SID336]|uniref:AI-2E family transporter n=1 Tax=Microbacterium sp. p3-SID336 TaxID=2916212 RepID=UPI0021A77217|nr:AI-2E family transporter [Microbacterium sp. p3-SID336]MCT1479218.1 AI-2E family transporter [Microbacterium sp. p3-SID336]
MDQSKADDGRTPKPRASTAARRARPAAGAVDIGGVEPVPAPGDVEPVPAPGDVQPVPAPGGTELGARFSLLRRVVPARPLMSGFLVAIGVLLAVALAATIAGISTVLFSVFLGLFLALGLDPAVRALERRGVSRGVGVTIVAAAVLGVVAVIVLVLLPATVRQIVAAVEAAPDAIAAMQDSDWYLALEQALGIDLSVVIAEGLASLASVSSFLAITGGVLHAGSSVIGAVSSFVLVVVLTLYFVASLPAITGSLTRLMPSYRRENFATLLDEVVRSVGGVVAGGVTLSFVNAAVVFLIELALGSPIAAVMGIAAFFITIVPMIGSLLFLVIGTVANLFLSPTAALVFAIAYLVYIQVEAYFVTPRVMGRAAAVPGVLVIIGAMIGATLLGLLGALVAIPLTASLLIIIRQVWIPHQDSVTEPPDA